jgi:hypothetical protein
MRALRLLRELASSFASLLRSPRCGRCGQTHGVSGVPLLLRCPECLERHVDVGPWARKLHHTHACQNRRCGHVWRPSTHCTVGVWTLPGFLNETTEDPRTPSASSPEEVRRRFGETSPEYVAARLAFSQSPRPSAVLLLRTSHCGLADEEVSP